MNTALQEISAKHFVSAEDVLRLRREVFGDQLVDRDEAKRLFALADAAPGGDREWGQFLSEAVTDYFVRQTDPTGYVGEDDAAFLLDCFGPAEKASDLKIAALVHMISRATRVPQSLTRFGMEVVRAHVLRDGYIDEEEVAHLRTFLHAAGGDGNIAITRAEADYLFDLNDASRDSDNSLHWDELFSKAIVGFLMAHNGYQPVDRETALRFEEMMETGEARPPRSAYRGVLSLYKRAVTGEAFGGGAEAAFARKNAADVAGRAESEKLTQEETAWLLDRIGKDGEFDLAERTLMRYLAEMKDELPAPLQNLAERAGS